MTTYLNQINVTEDIRLGSWSSAASCWVTLSICPFRVTYSLLALCANMMLSTNQKYITYRNATENKKTVLSQRWLHDVLTKVNKQPHLHLRSR